MEREALKLALEVNESMKDVLKQVNELIAENKALKEALAQPAQEPVAGTKTWFEDGKVVTQYLTAKDIYKEPAQEPVAWMVYTLDGASVCVTDNSADFTPEHRALPLYTTPPTRPWVGLTDKELNECVETPYVSRQWANIEAKLKEKNT